MRILHAMIAVAASLPLAGAIAADKPDKPARICRVAQQTTGSHMRAPRRCHTEEEWRRIDEEAGRIPVSMRVNSSKNDGTQQRPQ